MTVYATDDTYDSLVREGVVLADFTATWCGPCKMLAQNLEELEDELPFLKIVKVDVDQCKGLAQRFHVYGVPYVIYYKDGEPVSQGPGAVSLEEIRATIADLLY